MNLRKTKAPGNGHKVFAPEAYADFDIVAPAKIQALRERIAPALKAEEFDLIDDITKG